MNFSEQYCSKRWEVIFVQKISAIGMDWSRHVNLQIIHNCIVFWKLVLMYKWNFVNSAIFIYLLSFMYKTVFTSICFHNSVTMVMLLNIYMMNCCTIPPVVHNCIHRSKVFFHTKMFPYVFHIKPHIFKKYSWIHYLFDFLEFFTLQTQENRTSNEFRSIFWKYVARYEKHRETS